MKIKYMLGIAALPALALAGAANAAITVSTADAAVPYAGPTPTFDFDSSTPTYVGGAVQTGSNSIGAQPIGSTGNYYTVGPVGASNSGPGVIDLSAFGGLTTLSLLWGSVDTYNTLTFLGFDGSTVIGSYVGGDIIGSDFGSQVLPGSNPLVTFNFTGTDQAVGFLKMESTSQAFEIDNIAVQAVPEPGTWLLMLLGFAAVGASMRARKSDSREVRVRYS